MVESYEAVIRRVRSIRSKIRSRVDSLPRDSFASVTARRLKGALDEARWRIGCRRGPPPPSFKRRLLRRTAEQHGLQVLVETGTFKGDTVAALRHRFEQIISIELSPVYAEAARLRFAIAESVRVVEGDSGSVLSEVVDSLGEPALFWLDGHASGGDTARGTVGSPVVAEVDAVLRSPCSHVVLIDDARCFDGLDGYPTLEDLEAQIRALCGTSVELVVADDIIRLVPA